MLHITNGDAVAERLKHAGIGGEVLPWREDLSEGPVAADPREPGIREARARFFEEAFGVPAGEFAAGCERQERTLDEAVRAGEEIVLWFEHDLYDQAMLMHLLHRIGTLQPAPQGLQLVCIGSYPGVEPFHGLGQLTAEQLAGLFPRRRAVTAGQLALARQAWAAYASPDPRSVEALLPALAQAPAAAELPFLRDAFAAHLSRFPSTRDGLGRVEREALRQIAEGTDRLIPLFQRVTGPLAVYGLGDLTFWAHLDRLRTGPRPLIAVDGGTPALPRFGDGGPFAFDKRVVRLTDDGRDVLAGRADAVERNGINRILGGVRLEGTGRVWRYDDESARLEFA